LYEPAHTICELTLDFDFFEEQITYHPELTDGGWNSDVFDYRWGDIGCEYI